MKIHLFHTLLDKPHPRRLNDHTFVTIIRNYN